MHEMDQWDRFLRLQSRRFPLPYVNGMRHAAKIESYCSFHSHPVLEIVYHPTGKGVTRIRKGETIPFKEQSVLVYAPHEEHDQTMECDGEDLCVQISLPSKSPRRGFTLSHIHPVIAEEIRMLSQGYTGVNPQDQAIFNLRATAVLFSLIRLSLDSWKNQEASISQQHVSKAIDYIRNHLSEIQSLSQVVDHVGISHDHLRHLFKSMQGKSLVRHLNEARIERAKSLLVHSPLPLKQIAELCGFKDEYYFSAVFRSLAHVAPGHYRQSHSS
jgi:AraC-like DNA-binding protein